MFPGPGKKPAAASSPAKKKKGEVEEDTDAPLRPNDKKQQRFKDEAGLKLLKWNFKVSSEGWDCSPLPPALRRTTWPFPLTAPLFCSEGIRDKAASYLSTTNGCLIAYWSFKMYVILSRKSCMKK